MKLNDKLNSLSAYPFHMPGHKRNSDFNIACSEIDITEIDGFDNLHNPQEVLFDLEEDIKQLFSSKKSIISVNGSTCCILAAVSAVCNRGNKIIIARNCHKSVYNACLINELRVAYIEPEFDKNFGVYTFVRNESVQRALSDNPDAKAIVITSPTYEGVVSNIDSPIPVIIDSAHGSHFGFADYLPERANSDIVVNSLHKTLPCLTQCAVVHINNEKLVYNVKKYMDIFETSSPSYVLLSSVDKCVDFLKNSTTAFENYKVLLDNFRHKIFDLKNIRFFNGDDITRIVLSADGYSGSELAAHLRKNGIEPEGFGVNYVILISTVCDSQQGFDLLVKALLRLEKRSCTKRVFNKPVLPLKALEQYEVTAVRQCPLEESVGKISGENIFAYPPDIPLITTGEIISDETVKYIKLLIDEGVNVLSDSGLLPFKILTKAD